MKIKALILLSIIGIACGQLSCDGACGSAIQVDDVIECYCHTQCVLEKPGPCCSDFADKCPSEYAEGMQLQNSSPGQGKGSPKGPKQRPPQAANPKLPAGCELPDSNVIAVPANTMNWDDSGYTCVDHCDTMMVAEDDSLVCFCDSGCLLTADCCPDFIKACPVDPCILALVLPEEPTWTTCQNSCGGIVTSANGGFCSCETACLETFTCCPDFADVCPNLVDVSLTPPVPEESASSCFQKCGGGAGSCWCDYDCVTQGDCCEDYEDMCGSSFGLIKWQGHGSCHGKCGGSGFDCWCDKKCLTSGDCCADYLPKCQTASEGTCADGACGGFGGGCWCDDMCGKHGDCCADKKLHC